MLFLHTSGLGEKSASINFIWYVHQLIIISIHVLSKYDEINSYYNDRFKELLDIQTKSVNVNHEENYVSILLIQSLISNWIYLLEPYYMNYTSDIIELRDWEQEIERRRQNVLFSLGPNAHFFSLKK